MNAFPNDKETCLPKMVLIDQLYMQFYVPDDLPGTESRALTRTLKSSRLHRALQKALTTALQQFPTLARVRSRLAR